MPILKSFDFVEYGRSLRPRVVRLLGYKVSQLDYETEHWHSDSNPGYITVSLRYRLPTSYREKRWGEHFDSFAKQLDHNGVIPRVTIFYTQGRYYFAIEYQVPLNRLPKRFREATVTLLRVHRANWIVSDLALVYRKGAQLPPVAEAVELLSTLTNDGIVSARQLLNNQLPRYFGFGEGDTIYMSL